MTPFRVSGILSFFNKINNDFIKKQEEKKLYTGTTRILKLTSH